MTAKAATTMNNFAKMMTKYLQYWPCPYASSKLDVSMFMPIYAYDVYKAKRIIASCPQIMNPPKNGFPVTIRFDETQGALKEVTMVMKQLYKHFNNDIAIDAHFVDMAAAFDVYGHNTRVYSRAGMRITQKTPVSIKLLVEKLTPLVEEYKKSLASPSSSSSFSSSSTSSTSTVTAAKA
eukprot:TRINITY_DN127_c0_g1_i1.p1 TRINITY_DN127_c0_g1~~TRINITY_DN127_c0_g1_i1.p1  ORF type:complete len:179 (+),score=64.57 TRINITY_DN127_c0_g1_i1:95-631(+)